MPLFQVKIINEENNLIGYLWKGEAGESNLKFNPLNILSDLSSPSLNKILKIPYVIIEYSLEELWSQTDDPFIYSAEYGFTNPIQIKDNERDLYTRCVKDIRKILQLKQSLKFQDLELFKNYLDITTRLTIADEKDNPFSAFSKNVPETHTCPISYGYYTLEQLFKKSLSNNLIYFYDCFSLRDVLYAVLHYLIIHEYKFVKCKHCGRYFATTNLKQEYCKRKSPYINYKGQLSTSDKECEEAVRLIQKRLRNRRKNLYNDYYARENGDEQIFLEQYKPYEKEIKNSPSLSSLKKYEHFLYNENKLGKTSNHKLP